MTTKLKSILVLTENERLRSFMKPLAQWLDLHIPIQPVDALEHMSRYQPDLFIIDATAMTPMVKALLTSLRQLPQYQRTPTIVVGEDEKIRAITADSHMVSPFNLRRMEERIAELLHIRLVGRGTHGPHHGSIY